MTELQAQCKIQSEEYGQILTKISRKISNEECKFIESKKCSLQFVQVKDIEVKLFKCLYFDVL